MDQYEEGMPEPTSSVSEVTSAIHHPEFAKVVIFTDDVVEYIKHALLKETLDAKNNWVLKSFTDTITKRTVNPKPLMSREGVEELSVSVRINVTRFCLLSKMEKEEINKMLEITADDLDVWLAQVWKKYEIPKEVYFSDIISDSIINLYQSLMKMSQDGSLQEFFKKTIVSKEIIGKAEGEKKGLSMPTFFKRSE